MEQFLNEVREYANRIGKKPSTVVQDIAGLSGRAWRAWVEGQAFPRIDTVDKIRAHIAADTAPTASTPQEKAGASQ